MIWKILIIIALFMSVGSLWAHTKAIAVLNIMADAIDRLEEQTKDDQDTNIE